MAELSRIKLIVLDVDGVLTDGGIRTEESGERVKRFYVQDGYALKRWRSHGGQVAVLSGRDSEALHTRLQELGIEHVRTGSEEKSTAFNELLDETGYQPRQTAYVGDDHPDLAPMKACEFPVAVANAVADVKRSAEMVTRRSGGSGAVAELVEFLLRKQGLW
ncbi:MAG: KdsC family phosphatase [Planctomycetota bacterium]|jgi:3-deoxy-D-manno-octulosonate 8-phosphate phosphatase (KDO 8-P phosphatase)